MDKITEKIFCEVIRGLMTKNSAERCVFVTKELKLITACVPLLKKLVVSGSEVEQTLALKCLLSLSELTEVSNLLLNEVEENLFWPKLLQILTSNTDTFSYSLLPFAIGLLVNLSINPILCHSLCELIREHSSSLLHDCIHLLNTDHRTLACDLITNLSQLDKFRNYLCENGDQTMVLINLTMDNFRKCTDTFTKMKYLFFIKNLCFDSRLHKYILESKSLTILLFPITGPTELELDDEDMAKIPIELQYLPSTNKREESSELRILILECFLLLLSNSESRKKIRQSNAYFIFRELHKWETVKNARKAVEDVVDILIKDEGEYRGISEIKQLDVDQSIAEKFNEMDKDYFNE